QLRGSCGGPRSIGSAADGPQGRTQGTAADDATHESTRHLQTGNPALSGPGYHVRMPSDLTEDLKLLIRSRHPVVAIETADELRAVQLVRRVAQELDRPLFEWSVTSGLRRT